MITDETLSLVVATPEVEAEASRELAERYGLEFVNVHQFRIDNELFRSVPFDLMLRYLFLPEERTGRPAARGDGGPDRCRPPR